MGKEKLFFVDNDAIFYYFFRDKLYLFKPLISKLFKVNISDISKIVLLNKKPYLDDVFNKYNVLYLQIRILNKYVYLIVNNIDDTISTKYSENYMLNIELMGKYKSFYQHNKGDIKNAYFIFSKEKWIERIIVWTNERIIIPIDLKYIFNISNKNSYILKDIKKILNIVSISNKYDFNKQGNGFKKEYIKTINLINNSILKEADVLKRKRNKLILDSIDNDYIKEK